MGSTPLRAPRRRGGAGRRSRPPRTAYARPPSTAAEGTNPPSRPQRRRRLPQAPGHGADPPRGARGRGSVTAMELTHRFTVPTGVEETWAHFNDIASVAECFPGAPVTSADGRLLRGLGQGQARPDRAGLQRHRHVRREGRGGPPVRRRRQGQGQARQRHRRAPRSPLDHGRRRRRRPTSRCVTDLAITGKPAQFGRGVMQDVSDKLLGQFVACLEQRFGAPAARQPDDPRSPPAPRYPRRRPPRCRRPPSPTRR